MMLKKFTFFTAFTFLLSGTALALTARSAVSDYVSENTYNNLYPYMNNSMRTNLNPGTTPSQSNAPINVLTRTQNTSNSTSTRNVVSRSATPASTSASSSNNARSATSASAATARAATGNSTSTRRVTARSASPSNLTTARSSTTTNTARAASPVSSTRRVVARSGTSTASTGTMQSANTRTSRQDGNVSTARETSQVATYTSTGTPISSARCMADYTECMNGYCERENTEYNRCYCSSKLAQIDAQYKPAIDSLIKEILTVKNGNNWTDEEMNEYWMDVIGKYTGENSWTNLEDALDIDWASTESRVRGQQAFAMGHEYCVQYLKGCAYMQTNLRDAYSSEIARDCATYESSLQKLKNAAESIVEAYK